MEQQTNIEEKEAQILEHKLKLDKAIELVEELNNKKIEALKGLNKLIREGQMRQ